MKNYFRRSCKMLLTGIAIASCQGVKQHVEQPNEKPKRSLPLELCWEMMEWIPTGALEKMLQAGALEEMLQPVGNLKAPGKTIIRKRYNAENPYEVDGGSQENFQIGSDFVKKFGIPHVRYRNSNSMGLFLPEPIRGIIEWLQLDSVKSLKIVNANGSSITHLDLHDCQLNDNQVAWLLSKLAPKQRLQLKTLNLRKNQLTTVAGLENLSQLRSLDLDCNQLTTVSGLGNLSHLERLFLRKNQLTTVSGLENLPQLRTLNLGNNKLTTILGLGNLPQLRTLDLDNNQLTTVSGLENRPQLRTLDLSYNQFTTVSELENLPQLRRLYLNYNQLTTVSGLENLSQLRILDLNYNQLTTVSGLENLSQLKYLYLINNPFPEEYISELPQTYPNVSIITRL